jgi:hypothetical protein
MTPDRSRPRRRWAPALVKVCAVAVAAGLAWGSYAWATAGNRTTPSCSWPMRIRGTATAEQAGLVRCYLRALSMHDTAGLAAVADYDPPVRITAADLHYGADARAGLATADFAPSYVDSTFVDVTITFADGARDDTSMLDMIAMGDSDTWRLEIGTGFTSDLNAPPSAQLDPPGSPSPRG